MTYTLSHIRLMMRLSPERIKKWISRQPDLNLVPESIWRYRRGITEKQKQITMIALHLNINYVQAQHLAKEYYRSKNAKRRKQRSHS